MFLEKGSNVISREWNPADTSLLDTLARDTFKPSRLRPCTRSLAVLPLCFLDQQYLSFSSTLSILVNVYLVTDSVAALALAVQLSMYKTHASFGC